MRLLFILSVFLAFSLIFGCAQQKEEKKETTPAPQPSPAPTPTEKPKLGEGDQEITEEDIPKPPE